MKTGRLMFSGKKNIYIYYSDSTKHIMYEKISSSFFLLWVVRTITNAVESANSIPY
jgi:hypothetical protein